MSRAARRASIAGAALIAAGAACNTLRVTTRLQPPAQVAITSLPGGVRVSWSAVDGVAGYTLSLTTLGDPAITGGGYPYSENLDPGTTRRRIAVTPGATIWITLQSYYADRHSDDAPELSATALSNSLFGGTPVQLSGTATESFGYDVAAIGDVDGDGIGDLAIGAPGVAAVRVFSGKNDAPLTVLGGGPQFGRVLAGPGNVDADGRDEVFAGSGQSGAFSVYYDDQTTPPQVLADPNGTASDESAALRDVDGDGDDDLAIGWPLGGGGEVDLFLGSPLGLASQPDRRVVDATHSIGNSVAFGDFDCDGRVDLLVGATHDGVNNQGSVCLYSDILAPGSALTLAGCVLGVNTAGYLGDDITTVGDVDGDGCDDAVVADFPDSVGRTARLWRGSPTGPHPSGVPIGLGFDTFSSSGHPLHHLVAAAGDVDGDGAPDVFVGDPANGRVGLFLGTGDTLVLATTVPAPAAVSGSGSEFGASLAYANMDGDTQPDLLVGAPGANVAYLFHGLPTRGPVVDAGAPVSVGAGDTATLVVHAVDPAGQPGAAICKLDWGDGSPADSGAGVCSGLQTHAYAAAGEYHPILTMTTAAPVRSGMAETTVRVR